MKVESESEVAQLCLTLSDPVDYSLPGSSVHGIFQARALEWGAIAFSDVSVLIYGKSLCILSTGQKLSLTSLTVRIQREMKRELE